MVEITEYPYSKNMALMGIVLPLLFFGITFNNLQYSLQHHFIVSAVIISIADLIFLALFVFMLIKRLMPALRHEVALELNEEGITDYLRKIVIEWADVRDINLERGRNFSKMVIDLKQETDYGNQIAISLRWIQGKDMEICETAMAYFEEMTRLS